MRRSDDTVMLSAKETQQESQSHKLQGSGGDLS